MAIPSPLGTVSVRNLLTLCVASLCLAPMRGVLAEDLIANDHFADGGGSWSVKASKNGTANLSVTKEGSDSALCVEVEKTGDDALDVRILRPFDNIEAGKTYRLTFRAKCDQGAVIVPFVAAAGNTAKIIFRQQVNVDGDWKDFSFDFQAKDSETSCVLGFSHLGELTAKYYFADLALSSD